MDQLDKYSRAILEFDNMVDRNSSPKAKIEVVHVEMGHG